MKGATPTTAREALHSSVSQEWFTPTIYTDAARRLMNGIELDPASCDEANQLVGATRYYTVEDDGLAQPWIAESVWLNPPYGRRANGRSNQQEWSMKMIAEYGDGHFREGVLLVNAATDTSWFQSLWPYPICFVRGRIQFIGPGGKPARQPTHGSALVYFGSSGWRWELFATLFDVFGHVVLPEGG